MRNWNSYIKLARTLAAKSNHPYYRYGCILFKKNKILSTGYNKLTTHPKSNTYGHTIHGELHCILGVKQVDLYKANIFVYMENNRGNIGTNSKPCKNCENLLKSVGIKNVYYFNHNNIKCLKLN